MNKEEIKIQFYPGNDILLLLIGEEKISSECSVLSYSGFDWNEYLSPWKAKKVFKGSDFAGKADELISILVKDEIILNSKWKKKIIVGYSLAGLFSLYICTKTELFDGCVSVSGSLWYDNWLEYLKDNPIQSSAVYLSLGDLEKNTKNQRMALVEENTLNTKEILEAYTEVTFEMNPGNHFYQAEERLIKGVQRMEEMI